MEPITLIITALVAGLTDVAKDTVKDSYSFLKEKLTKKLEANKEAKKALEKLEEKPVSEGRQLVLKEELAATEVEQNPEILEAAKILLVKLNQQHNSPKYNITVSGGQIGSIGDNTVVNILNRTDNP